MPARRQQTQDLFTASQVARFCQVDLKTIHNWADRDRILHFRTPGRHLRFRRADVLDFLRKYGYPIPEELEADRPRVALLVEPEDKRAVERALSESFEVVDYRDAADGLLGIGEQPPDAVVLGMRCGGLSGAEIIGALKRSHSTQHVRAVLFDADEADKEAALEAGASAHVGHADLRGLRDTLEALMGVGR
ncbi:MAG: helix-turn-helix domain-containing protein [Myxococcota bacterium]